MAERRAWGSRGWGRARDPHSPLLAEPEDELRVVRHLFGRPRRVPRELGLDLLDTLHRGDRVADLLLDHGADGTAHRREREGHTGLGALHLDVVEKAEVDDVHAELRVLDDPESVDDLFAGRHETSLSRSSRLPVGYPMCAVE